jgi:hypothetical protein
MTAPQSARSSNNSNIVDEMFTDAKIDALNSKLIERGISADQVIAILPVEAKIMVNPTPPQFRVLYRTVLAVGFAALFRMNALDWVADWMRSAT